MTLLTKAHDNKPWSSVNYINTTETKQTGNEQKFQRQDKTSD
jgi:hypothetical protein